MMKSKLKNLSLFYYIFFSIISFLFLYYNPIIQDDAWATSFVVSKIKFQDPFLNGLIDSFDKLSYRTYYNWFNFIPLEIGIRLFGANQIGARFHIFIYGILISVVFNLLIKAIYNKENGILILIGISLVSYFNVHYWNRSEIPALFYSMLAIYCINIKNEKGIFFSFLFFIISFDIHPTSIFLTTPFIFLKNKLYTKKAFLYIFFSTLLGIIIIISSKLQFISYSQNWFDFIAKSLHIKGGSDHYPPVLNIRSHDFLFTEKTRLLPFLKLFSPVILLFIFNFRNLYTSSNFKYFTFSLLINVLLSIFITDTVSNGYQLYMLFSFSFFTIFVVTNINYNKWNLILLGLLSILYIRSASISISNLSRYIKDKNKYEEYYEGIDKYLSNKDFVGGTPQYFFITNNRNIHMEYFFTILLEANNTKNSVLSILSSKKYDKIILTSDVKQLLIKEEKEKYKQSLYYNALPTMSLIEYNNYFTENYTLIYSGNDPLGKGVQIFKAKQK